MIIVVTGGIGSGKSRVCEILSNRYRFHVYEADARVKELYIKHPTLLVSLEKVLGASLRDKNGRFIPSALAELIFDDTESLKKVESLVFPALIQDFEKWKSELVDDLPIVFESATILEKPYFNGFGDLIVLVDAPYALRLERAAERDGDRDEVSSRMQLQGLMNRLSDGGSDPRIGYVIDNSGSIDELEKKISVLVSDIYLNNNVPLLKQHS